jgi:DNA-binding NarL/FixJ family response regulator
MPTRLDLEQLARTGTETRETDENSELPIRVLFVEDDQLCSRAFRRALAQYGVDCSVADTVSAARRLLRENGSCFDAVLLDLRLPDGRGEDLLSDIEGLSPQPGIVIFSDFLEDLRPEAASYRTVQSSKQIAPGLLATILRLAAKGYAHSTLARFSRQFGLSCKEADILNRVAGGTNPKQIALDIDCSIQAVYAHLLRIGKKTDCDGYHEVVAKLFRFACHSLGHSDWFS